MEKGLIKSRCDSCVYRAPLGGKDGEIWCAGKGAYVEPKRECVRYKERRP